MLHQIYVFISLTELISGVCQGVCAEYHQIRTASTRVIAVWTKLLRRQS